VVTHREEHELGTVGRGRLDGCAGARDVASLVRRHRELAQRHLELRPQNSETPLRSDPDRTQNQGNSWGTGGEGVTLESGGAGGSTAGGERAASGRKEEAAVAIAARRRRRRKGRLVVAVVGVEVRRREGERREKAVDVAAALIGGRWRGAV
jgi:hypothetical protein